METFDRKKVKIMFHTPEELANIRFLLESFGEKISSLWDTQASKTDTLRFDAVGFSTEWVPYNSVDYNEGEIAITPQYLVYLLSNKSIPDPGNMEAGHEIKLCDEFSLLIRKTTVSVCHEYSKLKPKRILFSFPSEKLIEVYNKYQSI